MSRRRCCIPMCPTEDSDGKQFFKIDPLKLREIVGQPLSASNLCCQIHFDLANDTKNFIRFKHLPGKVLILREGTLPHRKIPANVCRICLKLIFQEDEFVSISDKNSPEKAEMIKTCLPELDLSLSFDPVACQKCFKSVESYYQIKKQSLKTEVTVVKCVKEIARKYPNKLVKSCSINLFENFDIIKEIKAEIDYKDRVQVVDLESSLLQSNPATQNTDKVKGETRQNKTETDRNTIEGDQNSFEHDQNAVAPANDRSNLLEEQNDIKNAEVVADPSSGIYQLVYLDGQDSSVNTNMGFVSEEQF